jgi:hypothetical protein
MQVSHCEDRSLEIINKHFENYVAWGDERLIPIKLIDSMTCVNFESCKLIEDLKEGKQMNRYFASESQVEPRSSVLEGKVLISMDENVEKTNMREFEESLENSITLEVEELNQISVVQTSVNDDDNSIEADNAQGTQKLLDL